MWRIRFVSHKIPSAKITLPKISSPIKKQANPKVLVSPWSILWLYFFYFLFLLCSFTRILFWRGEQAPLCNSARAQCHHLLPAAFFLTFSAVSVFFPATNRFSRWWDKAVLARKLPVSWDRRCFYLSQSTATFVFGISWLVWGWHSYGKDSWMLSCVSLLWYEGLLGGRTDAMSDPKWFLGLSRCSKPGWMTFVLSNPVDGKMPMAGTGTLTTLVPNHSVGLWSLRFFQLKPFCGSTIFKVPPNPRWSVTLWLYDL